MVTPEERREQKRIYLKECRAFWREHGICTKCGKEKVFYGHKVCADCLYKENERKRKRVRSEEERIRNNERQKERYYDHKTKGICVNCNRKATPGMVYCADCRMVMRRSNQQWTQRSGRKKGYAEAGLCIRCGGERVEGRNLCAGCLEKQRESMAYARQFTSKDGLCERNSV